MDPTPEKLRMFGVVSDLDAVPWSWVEEQLTAAGTYWVAARSPGHPHPRPVWGVWLDGALQLSVGSPVLARQLAADAAVTVHLDSGTDVVIVEGRAAQGRSDDQSRILDAYNVKYDWNYSIDEYGPLTAVAPIVVMAWRAAGRAGRDGFRQVGRWRFG